MVFQSYALYPHLTVRENIGFGLAQAKLPKDQIAQKVAAAAEALQLTPLRDRKPKALSGGGSASVWQSGGLWCASS